MKEHNDLVIIELDRPRNPQAQPSCHEAFFRRYKDAHC